MADGKVAVVTGGGRGIGRAIAVRLAQDGLHTALWARTQSEIETVASEIRDAGGEAIAILADVTDWESVRKATELTLKAFARIDVLVNNAGIGGPRGLLAEADPHIWARTIEVDLIGPFHCMRAVLPEMMNRRAGKIINVSGGGAGEPTPGNSAYGTAKTGLVRLSETVAHEVRDHNIQVNAMTPGLVVTRLTEDALQDMQGRDPERATRYREALETRAHPPEAGAEIVAYLASEQSDGLTGRWMTVYDDWQQLVKDPARLMDEDLFVLRRHPR